MSEPASESFEAARPRMRAPSARVVVANESFGTMRTRASSVAEVVVRELASDSVDTARLLASSARVAPVRESAGELFGTALLRASSAGEGKR